ncbi:molybdopterin converting factor subunit 1 [Halobacillus hunanensis]|uniref:molybdopterin converting factor subunit 1 n=1 Tax=Halobacillus hunanensis TaxID=578214 RepID=UPI0009A68AC3|nr:molybdopterin converting factor subunit 1 [Halobacillus hunanensis]
MNRILLFAGLQEKAGQESIDLEAAGKTVEEIKQEVGQQYQLERLHEAMTAVNEEYAANDYKVADGDVIAFIPPVSGG